MLCWIRVGVGWPRLELFGRAMRSEPDAPSAPIASLATVRALRVRNQEAQQLLLLELSEILLDELLPLAGELPPDEDGDDRSVFDGDPPAPPPDPEPTLFVSSLPAGELVLEGLEVPLDLLLDLVRLDGWKLALREEAGEIRYALHLLADWDLSTHPDHYPGAWYGEASFSGPDSQGRSVLAVPWPFNGRGKLEILAPVREGDEWIAAIEPSTLSGLLDSLGEALSAFPLAGFLPLDVSRLPSAIEELREVLSFRVRLDAARRRRWELRIALTPELGGVDGFPIAELAGQRLVLHGAATFTLSATLGAATLDLEAAIDLAAGAGFAVTGPLISQLEQGRRALAFVSDDPAAIPRLDLSFRTRQAQKLTLASCQIPTWWDAEPSAAPIGFSSELLSTFDLGLDGAGLHGLRFGSMEGATPRVQLSIDRTTPEITATAVLLHLDLTLAIAALDPLKARWTFELELSTLSFRPAATVQFFVPGNRFDAFGLHVEGLGAAAISFVDGQIVIDTGDLRAFYDGLSSPGDVSPGFELAMRRLRFSPAGVDAELHLIGGAPKLIGIGEAFKGVEGAITFAGSRVEMGFIRAQGPLPWLDNATGSLTLIFRDGLELDQAKAEFQLGLHGRAVWWFEVDLKALRIDLDRSTGRTVLLPRISGALAFKPPADAGDAVVRYLGGLRMEFTDLVLTRAFADVPPKVSLVVGFHKAKKAKLFNVFDIELRSVGLVPASIPGEAAIKLGCQVFFSGADLLDLDIELHDLKIQLPQPGSLVPQVSATGLAVRLRMDPVEVSGFVDMVDTEERKGFEGGVSLAIRDLFGIALRAEIMRVLRPSDHQLVRVWSVYGEVMNLNVPLIPPVFLRDVGAGFGWRKTLAALDDPELLERPGSTFGATASPQLRSSWVDDLEGEDARWTFTAAAWATVGMASRDAAAPLTGELLLMLRSDLTVLAAVRGWFMRSLNGLKASGGGGRPAVFGRLLINPRRRHLLAEFSVDPAAAAPDGIPPFLASAFSMAPVPFVFETRPDFFRLEVAWPRQLQFPMGIWNGRGGFLVRISPSAVTLGLGLEIYRSYEAHYSFGAFGGSVFLNVFAYFGFWGELVARIGAGPALWGAVGLAAILKIEFGFELRIKIGWIKIVISISFDMEISLSARLEFGISGSGVGFEGEVSVTARIWRFGFTGRLRLAINGGAVAEARNAVLGLAPGVAAAGLRASATAAPPPPRVMPEGVGALPVLPAEWSPRWTALAIEQAGAVYVLLLPGQDAWFATPRPNEVPESTPRWPASPQPDYSFRFTTTGVDAAHVTYLCGGAGTSVAAGRADGFVDWSASQGGSQVLGDRFGEAEWMSDELRLIQAILDDSRYRPRLLADWRVRSEHPRGHADRAAEGLRPDVRSPAFSAEDSLYDQLLEEACSPNEALSWPGIAVGLTTWRSHFLARDGGQIAEELLADNATDPPTDPQLALLRAVERWTRDRNTLAAELLRAFRDWIAAPVSPPPSLLAHAGVAFKFPRTGGAWSIHFSDASVRTTRDGSATLVPVTVEGDPLTSSAGGLGFGDPRRSYRVRDVLELQSAEDVSFSWRLECTDEQQQVLVLTQEMMAGLVEEPRFQFFDHYEIVRTNLSRDEAPAPAIKVRPGFIPVLADLGGASQTFRLLAPRFDLTDKLQGVAAPGDVLLYRITAVDTFGQRSLAIEHVTTRRDLRTPEAPRRVDAEYAVRLSPTGVTEESVTLALRDLTPGVRHEVWARSHPIGAGGYFGFGDEVDDDPSTVLTSSATDPQGMSLVASLLPGVAALTLTGASLGALSPGQLHELYVRAVSAEGAVSRLRRCEHAARIAAAAPGSVEPRAQAFLERIPAPVAASLSAWVLAEDLRVEARPAPVPRPGALVATELEHVASADPAERQVVLRLLHERSLDAAGLHPTGGYEVQVRDRDASVGDDGRSYERLAELEVVSLARYRSSPHTTASWSTWSGRYLRAGEASGFVAANALGGGEELAWLDWGAVAGSNATPCGRIATMPEGGLLHVHLERLLHALQQAAAPESIEVHVHSAAPSLEQTAERTFATLLEAHADDKDPNCAGLLAVLGRSVDVHFGKNGEPLPASDVLARVRAVVDDPAHAEAFAHHVVLVELLLQGDRRTPLGHVRLSLQPRLVAFPALPEPARTDEVERLQRLAFERYCAQLVGFGVGAAGSLELDSRDTYQRFTQRLLRQRPISTETVAVGVAYHEAGGSFERPLHDDDTVSVPLYYKEEYARRFSYRVRRLTRYARIYRELGLWPATSAEPGDAVAAVVRLPRVKPPAEPAMLFLGNPLRPGAPPMAEWLVEEHEEESMVQANETLRNRLGYRGLAWTLHAEASASWLRWAGWEGEGPSLPPAEAEVLTADASWADPSPSLPSEGALLHHPFLGLLQPKGTVVRIPRLPYYYRYRLAAFARADDLDSSIKVVDAAQVVPELVPSADEATAGWRVVREATADEPARIELWWRVPPVWDSLEAADRAIWSNEAPLARRLWDFDLEFGVELLRNQCRTRMLGARLSHARSGAEAAYEVLTGGGGLYAEDARRVERLPDVRFPAPQTPELRIQVNLVRKLEALLVRPEELVFDLVVSRSYGRGLSQRSQLVHRESAAP